MDTTVIATIIAVLGTGFLALLGFFLRSLRTDIATLRDDMRAEMRAEFAALRAEMRAEFTALRSDIAQLQQAVARLEATTAEHGRQLDRFAGHGERITALETAAAFGTA